MPGRKSHSLYRKMSSLSYNSQFEFDFGMGYTMQHKYIYPVHIFNIPPPKSLTIVSVGFSNQNPFSRIKMHKKPTNVSQMSEIFKRLEIRELRLIKQERTFL